MQTNDAEQYIEWAREVLQIEADGLKEISDGLNGTFAAAADTILSCTGRLVVMGIGKSGHVGHKIAATLASTGTPAFFVHPTEAAHGDLGMIVDGDVVLAISNSGESDEISAILPALKRKNICLICITAHPESTMARHADIHLTAAVSQEACPLGLAPTTSTTATLALGDALAITLMQARQFNEQDFARSHPYGRLGRRLMTKVGDVMRRDAAVPQVARDASVQTALFQITDKGLGVTLVSDGDRLLGIFTDGDLRRALEKYPDALQRPIAEVMTRAPQTTAPAVLAAEALQHMEARHITALPVLDGERIAGIIHIHDLLRAGVA